MKARIKWVEQVSFLGETESGHAVLMDGPADGGGPANLQARGRHEDARGAEAALGAGVLEE